MHMHPKSWPTPHAPTLPKIRQAQLPLSVRDVLAVYKLLLRFYCDYLGHTLGFLIQTPVVIGGDLTLSSCPSVR